MINERASDFCEKDRQFWCCCKSNDLNFSTNMRWKSWIVKWNFEIDFRSFDESVAKEISEHVVDVVFTRFDFILNVNNVKRERFDEMIDIKTIENQNICFDVAEMTSEINEFLVYSENVSNLDIENFDEIVDEMIDEIVCEIVEILFFSLLKFRFETFLSIFFVWCWRMCSWNLFFDSKILSQCLQTIFLQTIFWICCNKRANDEKDVEQLKQKWYWDEKRKTNESKKRIWIENFAKNAMIKISSHSFRFFLTISLSFCCLYQINAESRKHSNNNVNKFDSRYWCWRCRNRCTKFAISQNRLNFWISQMSVASKKSTFATIEVNFATSNSIRLTIFEVFFSSCMTRKHWNEFRKWYFSDSFSRSTSNISIEQWVHCAL